MEQSLAPTVVESNVPERTRRRGEYGARVSGREITVCVFAPSPLKQQEQTKPEFLGGFTESLLSRRREARDWSRRFFFLFRFFLIFLKEDSVFRGGLFFALAAKMMVGEVEVKERPRPSPDYLMQLLNEKKLMTSLPNLCGIFTHLERLLDEGKRASLERMWGAIPGEGGGSVTTAQSGVGTASLGVPAAETVARPRRTLPSGTPTLLTVAGIVKPITSTEHKPHI